MNNSSINNIGIRRDQKVINQIAECYKISNYIDILAMTAESSAESIDTFKNNMITKTANIRILALNPESALVPYRFKYLNGRPVYDLKSQNQRALQNYIKFADDLKKEHSEELRETESTFEYRFYDSIPYFSYVRCDDTIFLGIYTSNKITRLSNVLKVEFENDRSLFEDLTSNFDTIWMGSMESSIIRIEKR
ncbi:MAG: hypothetical protein P4L35_00570 [Ignavibacteriaceae bacterium]|nr:hypothetical protein [Ignavibacteriaceae bacterium]